MVVHLDRLAPHQGAVRDEQPYGGGGGNGWGAVAEKRSNGKESEMKLPRILRSKER
jgi:hypothetical protein